ncbi:MAG: nodulation protein NfeD, partial [Nitrospirota bacterium]|nr:nodulation protein NfeD [Nitrospirota bacterium]
MSFSQKHGFIRDAYFSCFFSLSLFTIFVPFLIEIVVPPLIYSEQSVVAVATYEGVINPVSSEYLHDAIEFAETEHALCLVFQLDTPGGLDSSMRSMIKDMTASRIPIVVYISPSGGRATSAGVFITLAAHIAAMAPGTTIGAAHPVAMGGAQMDEVMKKKVENDSVAYIHSLAERRGRNVNWAEDAVRKSVSATDTQAKELGIIDLVAPSLDQLLQELHGREIKLGAKTIRLATENSVIREFPMGWRLEVLKAISDPNIAYVLMTIGM